VNGPGKPGGNPPAVKPWAPEDSLFRQSNSVPRRLSFCLVLKPAVWLTRYAVAMLFGSLATPIAKVIADRLANMLEPQTCPGKFDTQYRKSNRDDNQCGTRRYDHNDAKRKNSCSQYSHRDAARGLVCQMNCFSNHASAPVHLPCIVFVL